MGAIVEANIPTMQRAPLIRGAKSVQKLAQLICIVNAYLRFLQRRCVPPITAQNRMRTFISEECYRLKPMLYYSDTISSFTHQKTFVSNICWDVRQSIRTSHFFYVLVPEPLSFEERTVKPI